MFWSRPQYSIQECLFDFHFLQISNTFKSEVSMSFFEQQEHQLDDFRDSEIALPMPLEPPKTIA